MRISWLPYGFHASALWVDSCAFELSGEYGGISQRQLSVLQLP